MKRKLPEKFFEQNQRAKTRKWKFFNLNQALWGAGNREFRLWRFPQRFLWEPSCGDALGIQRKERLQFGRGKLTDPSFSRGYGEIGQIALSHEHFVDALFKGSRRHEAIDENVASLSDAVGAVGGLCFNGRIPP